MYHVNVQGVDERLTNVHYYYYYNDYTNNAFFLSLLPLPLLCFSVSSAEAVFSALRSFFLSFFRSLL